MNEIQLVELLLSKEVSPVLLSIAVIVFFWKILQDYTTFIEPKELFLALATCITAIGFAAYIHVLFFEIEHKFIVVLLALVSSGCFFYSFLIMLKLFFTPKLKYKGYSRFKTYDNVIEKKKASIKKIKTQKILANKYLDDSKDEHFVSLPLGDIIEFMHRSKALMKSIYKYDSELMESKGFFMTYSLPREILDQEIETVSSDMTGATGKGEVSEEDWLDLIRTFRETLEEYKDSCETIISNVKSTKKLYKLNIIVYLILYIGPILLAIFSIFAGRAFNINIYVMTIIFELLAVGMLIILSSYYYVEIYYKNRRIHLVKAYVKREYIVGEDKDGNRRFIPKSDVDEMRVL